MTPQQQPAKSPLLPPENADDLSTHRHRAVIGALGAALPLACWFVSWLRPIDPTLSEPLESISAYAYSGAAPIFAGILACLAVYFLTYSGYANDDRWKDRTAAWIAAVAAIGVACFPTRAPAVTLELRWWRPSLGAVHLICAGILFGSFIFFALVLFPKSSPTAGVDRGKRRRNVTYRFCGVGMLASILWAAFRLRSDASIFWQETLALELFALCWLIKGRAHQAAGRLMNQLRRS